MEMQNWIYFLIFTFLFFSCKKEQNYFDIHQKLKSQYTHAKKALEENLQNQFDWPNPKELIGIRFPHFDVRDIQNKNITEKTFNGRFQLINMWFIQCRPCILEIPVLIELKHNYANLEIISFCRDNNQSLQSFLNSNPLPFWNIPQSQELIENVFPIYGGYPCNVLLDKKGRIAMITGSLNNKEDYNELINLLDKS